MSTNKRRPTKVTFNIYIIAGLYLLYIDYSLISDWKNIDNSRRVLVGIIAAFFALAGIGIVLYALKGLKDIKERNEMILETNRKKEEAQAQAEVERLIEEARRVEEIDHEDQENI